MRIPFFIQLLLSWAIITGVFLILAGFDLDQWATVMAGGGKALKYEAVGINLILGSAVVIGVLINIERIITYFLAGRPCYFNLLGEY